MNKEQAMVIGFLRSGPIMHSHRRISEIVFEMYPDLVSEELAGVQIVGDDLCREAMQLIYGFSDWRNVPEAILEKWGY